MTSTATVDTSGLIDALQKRLAVGRRTASDTVNYAAYWVARNAFQKTTAVPVEKIDTELRVVTTARITPLGNVGKKRYSSGSVAVHGTAGEGDIKQVPIAALIISARANLGSNYNALTNYRWALAKNPFKGVTRDAGRRAMAQLIHRMIASRHSSVNFIRSGWVPALRKLGPLVQGRRGGPVNTSAYHDGIPRGDASPATEGWKATSSIENDTGTEGENQRTQNEALFKYGEPALNLAIEQERAQTMDYVQKKIDEANAKFNATP